MKKMMMAVAGLAMAVALTGCGGGSPKGVAEKFVLAIIQKDPGKAIEFYDDQLQSDGRDFTTWNSADMKKEKTALEELGKKINDDKYECESVFEEVIVPPEDKGYKLVNGKKFTGERATVMVQFIKGKDKKPDGLKVDLIKLDGKWKVYEYGYMKDKFETSDKK